MTNLVAFGFIGKWTNCVEEVRKQLVPAREILLKLQLSARHTTVKRRWFAAVRQRRWSEEHLACFCSIHGHGLGCLQEKVALFVGFSLGQFWVLGVVAH